ncbi:MAG TPA: ferritin [Bacteroidetes bacterium]|nr:ferritin [Bacteroidota bacterium]
MLSKNIEKALNLQIELEANSSQFYLAMASWAEGEGYSGSSNFLYTHSEEERMHMLKLIKFVNERGGKSIIPALTKPPQKYKSLTEVFNQLLEHEMNVTNEINNLVGICLEEKDYTTHNFLQWYVSEQIEEEALARTIMDKLKLVGDSNAATYMFDRDIEQMTVISAASDQAGTGA